MKRRTTAFAAVALVLVLVLARPASADRLHLDNGGVIVTDHWWIDGTNLIYEGSAGSVGIPRAIVIRIEPTEETAPAAEPADDPSADRAGEPTKARQPRPSTTPRPPNGRLIQATQSGAVRDLLSEGTAAFERRDFETASSKFLAAFEEEPGLTAGRVGYAVSELALGRDERALPVVLDGLVRDPGSADLHEVLGDLKDREESVEDASRAWREAFRLAPNDRLRTKIFKAERELAAGRDYTFSAAAHFNVRYDGALDPDLATQLTSVLESSWHELSGVFRHAPQQAITVLVYPEQQFRDVTQAPETVAGLYDGKIRVPLGGIRSVDERARRLLVHELTHAFVHSKTRGNCPRWLHEGLAQRSEGRAFRAADREGVKRLLREHAPGQWDSGSFSYPAALSLTAELESLRGFGAVVDLLDRLGDGTSLDAALSDAFSMTYEELCHRWAEGLRPGARP